MSTTILLFRQDLRLHDHPALTAAAQRGDVLPVFIYDEQVAGDWGFGGASQWWLHESLASLSASIDSLGGRLIYRRGNTVDVLLELQESVQADAIYFSRQYQPWSAGLEASINDVFGHKDVEVKRYPGTLLHEPGSVLTGSGTLFKVFTPFWRAANKLPTAMPVPLPRISWAVTASATDSLLDWKLQPSAQEGTPDWANGWDVLWNPGEDGAQQALDTFLEAPVEHYSEGRDQPAKRYTSRLSPHLKFGEISPRQVWAAAQQRKLSAPQRCTVCRDLGFVQG